MAKKGPKGKTFAELASEPTWSQTKAARTGENAIRPGAMNVAGDFFDLRGQRLVLEDADIGPGVAQQAVDSGASVVAESCGCGGGRGGCKAIWLDDTQVRSLRGGPPPIFTSRYRAPTWLELWRSADGEVVYAHGDVSWGGIELG